MERKPHLSVIIPAYNEAQRIPDTLLSVDKYLQEQDYSYEIIVADDGSKDDTAAVVTRMRKIVKNLSLLVNKKNHGKGYVVRQGMTQANGDLRLFMDADHSTSIDHVEKMWPYFQKGYDIVIGSRDNRDAKGAKIAVPQPFYRRIIGDVGNLIIQVVAVRGIWDTQNGFKVFTAKAAEDIFSRAKINRWGFDIEALALARRLGYKIAIVPVYWVNDPRSHVTWKGMLNVFRELLIIKWNLLRGVYDKK